ncbi:PLP-dependent aminotransferase family protein [Olivibacter sp. CPCC 100613]|uniref:aminotransferase-like domain-containing protein n=1 Tax=Olivibacter sp. CPCC 100613 TaxID=3079931 RepID=UPI002FFC98ED
MLPFTNLITLDKASSVAQYQQVSMQMIALIRKGIVKPGMRLPSTRELAQSLMLHRKTIVAAYNEMQLQGWTTAVPKKGVFVSSVLPELHPKGWNTNPEKPLAHESFPFFYKSTIDVIADLRTDLSSYDLAIDDGLPDARLAPLDLLSREYRARLKRNLQLKGGTMFLSTGSTLLREALTDYLSETRGIKAGVGNLLTTQGAQMGIYIAAQLLLRAGDAVIVGEPNYFMANDTFSYLNARIFRVPVDNKGLDVDKVEEICLRERINMLYVIPHHHHPTTVTLSPQRRMQLITLAQRFNFVIVEDDYDYDFHYQSSPFLPLVSYCPERVVYIGSFTKCLASSVRIGFMVAPEVMINEAARIQRTINLRGDFIMEEALASLIREGDIARHIKKSVNIYRDRRDHVCSLLTAKLSEFSSFEVPVGGMAVWLRFRAAYPLTSLATELSKYRLFMSNGKKYDTDRHSYNAIRFGFASLNKDELSKTVELLATVLLKSVARE